MTCRLTNRFGRTMAAPSVTPPGARQYRVNVGSASNNYLQNYLTTNHYNQRLFAILGGLKSGGLMSGGLMSGGLKSAHQADDLVIMAPSVTGLLKLLRICELFGASQDMIFNQKKSASVIFISKTLKGVHLPNVYLNGEVILQVNSVKYLCVCVCACACACVNRLLERLMSPSPKSQVMFASAFSFFSYFCHS